MKKVLLSLIVVLHTGSNVYTVAQSTSGSTPVSLKDINDKVRYIGTIARYSLEHPNGLKQLAMLEDFAKKAQINPGSVTVASLLQALAMLEAILKNDSNDFIVQNADTICSNLTFALQKQQLTKKYPQLAASIAIINQPAIYNDTVQSMYPKVLKSVQVGQDILRSIKAQDLSIDQEVCNRIGTVGAQVKMIREILQLGERQPQLADGIKRINDAIEKKQIMEALAQVKNASDELKEDPITKDTLTGIARDLAKVQSTIGSK